MWKGGLGIWGGIALGTAVGLWRAHRAGANLPLLMDAAAPALLVAQAIGRMGNYFNQELFGRPTSLPGGIELDPEHRPDRYAADPTFHPTFLYEIGWNLALAAVLVWLGRTGRVRAPGLFALYVVGYSGFRIFEELLRVDPAHHVLGLRLNFFIAVLLCAAGLVWFVRIQRGGRAARRLAAHGGPAALGLAWLICALAACGDGRAAHATADGLRRASAPASVACRGAATASSGRLTGVTAARSAAGRRPGSPGRSR